MAKTKTKIKIDIERINELLAIKKVIDSDKIVEWFQWSFVKFNSWDFCEDDAIKYFGKNECASNYTDYDYDYYKLSKTDEEMEEHRAIRGAENLAQNEYDCYCDYKSKGNSQDWDLLENMKDALKASGYKEGMIL